MAIGDGGNDVAMIKAAAVGVAIRGKEGNQAASFADYSVLRFKDLRRLMFWHGRNFGQNFANFTFYHFFKAMLLCVPQLTLNMELNYSGYQSVDDLIWALNNVTLTTFALSFYILLEQSVP